MDHRRSSSAAAPVVDRHKSKLGKSLLKLVKEFCDSISPSQINQLKVETEASAQALGSLSWRRSLSASAAAMGAKAHAIKQQATQRSRASRTCGLCRRLRASKSRIGIVMLVPPVVHSPRARIVPVA